MSEIWGLVSTAAEILGRALGMLLIAQQPNKSRNATLLCFSRKRGLSLLFPLIIYGNVIIYGIKVIVGQNVLLRFSTQIS